MRRVSPNTGIGTPLSFHNETTWYLESGTPFNIYTMKNFWNERYSQTDYVYGTVANDFLAKILDRCTPGRLLLPAEGEGRNAVYAAKQGWEVTAFDQSEAGREKALALAQKEGVEIDYRICAFTDFEAEVAQFDALGLIYAHLPPRERRIGYRHLLSFLKPVGTVFLEGFSKAQLGRKSGGPQKEALLFSKAELQTDFERLSELSITETEVDLEEGDYHKGKAMVLRLLGRK